MEKTDTQRSLFSWPTVAVFLAIALGGVYWLPLPFQRSRPRVVSPRMHATVGDENVEARLWQDPFQAVHEHVAASGERYGKASRLATTQPAGPRLLDLHGIDHLQDQIAQRAALLDLDADKTLLILPVMVTAAPYADDREERLRTRYAVLSALYVAGYVPEDETHIGFTRTSWIRAGQLATQTQSWVSRTRDIARTMFGAGLQELGQLIKGKTGAEPRRLTALRQAVAPRAAEPLEVPGEPDEAKAVKEGKGVKLIIPFEWYKLVGPNQSAARVHLVLVLWLQNDSFSDRPMKRIAMLCQTLLLNDDDLRHRTESGTIRVHLLGPADSTTLGAMLRDDPALVLARQAAANIPEWIVQKIRLVLASDIRQALTTVGRDGTGERQPYAAMYSPRATAANHLLLSAKQASGAPPIEDLVEQDYGLRLVRTTGTDDALAKCLIRELRRRPEIELALSETGLHLHKIDANIVLLSEWDSFYGRALPNTFGQVLRMMKDADLRAIQLHRYTYLRGVDGALPRHGSQDPKDRAEPVETNKAQGVKELERPEGPSQLDYVRRLAGTIQRLDRELKKTGEGKINAIGILGSDVYDKLLLLQALRPQFPSPSVVFFTTDLDARLLHPRELEWTQNLIVASHFGLQLKPKTKDEDKKLQGGIPPFRDCYQTAMFYSCLLAVRQSDASDPYSHPPRLYEIGREGAHDLSFYLSGGGKDQATGGSAGTAAGSPESVHPDTIHFLPWILQPWTWVGAVVVIVLGIIMLCHFNQNFLRIWRPRDDPTDKARRRDAVRLLVASALIVGALSGAFARWYSAETGEPFTLAAGISIWPTEALRLLAAFLSAFFLLKAPRDIRHSDRMLSDRYQLRPQEPPDNERGTKGWWVFVRHPVRFRERFSIACWEKNPHGPVNAQELWGQYLRLGSMRNRRIRAILLAGLYVALAGALMGLLGGPPAVPARDAFSVWMDRIILFISGVLMIYLIFFVVDATRLCNRFIGHLTASETQWREQKAAKRRNMEAQHLADWLDIQLVAERTQMVQRLIWYPFLILFLMIISRNSYFDNWDWPLSLVLVLGLNSLYAIYCAFTLRRTAERCRGGALHRLNDKLLCALGAGAKERVRQIESTIEEIRSNRTGAFMPLSRHPVVAAILLPFGGIGGLALIELLATGP